MSRFTDRQVTIQELIWQQKAGQGDMESLVLLLEARRSDPAMDIRSMTNEELPGLVAECMAGMQRSLLIADSLNAMARSL